jgi:hypothetical protein
MLLEDIGAAASAGHAAAAVFGDPHPGARGHQGGGGGDVEGVGAVPAGPARVQDRFVVDVDLLPIEVDQTVAHVDLARLFANHPRGGRNFLHGLFLIRSAVKKA